MGDADMRFRHQLVNLRGNRSDVLHSVMHVEHLATAQQLTPDRSSDLSILIRANVSKHRQAVFRRRGQRGHFTNARNGHLQRTRNRRCRQTQHIHIGTQRLQRLFVFDTETLLLIDDDQSQILEFDLRPKQFVRTDHHIDGTVFKSLDGVVDLLGGLETAHRPYFHRESFKTFGERLEMLLHQQCGRHQHSHLFGILHRLECGTYGDFGFAESHVAANQAIHRHGLFHIGFDFVDGSQLIGGFLVWESVFQFFLPRGVFAEGIPLHALTCRIQFDQIFGDFVHMLTCFRLGSSPIGSAQFVEFWSVGTDVFADLVKLIGGDEQFVGRGAAFAGCVFDDQIFACGLVGARSDGALAHFEEPADAMLLVHHVIAGLELH